MSENLAGQGMRKKYCIITMRARDLVSNPVYVVIVSMLALKMAVH